MIIASKLELSTRLASLDDDLINGIRCLSKEGIGIGDRRWFPFMAMAAEDELQDKLRGEEEDVNCVVISLTQSTYSLSMIGNQVGKNGANPGNKKKGSNVNQLAGVFAGFQTRRQDWSTHLLPVYYDVLTT